MIRRLIALFLILFTTLSCTKNMDGTISLDGRWRFKVDMTDAGLAEEWYRPEHSKADWLLVDVPSHWDRYNLETYDGVGWFARSVTVEDSSQSLAIFFGGVDDDADVWINGVKVGSHTGYSDAFYFDASAALRPGGNEVVVRVKDHSGPGGIYQPVTITPLEKVEDLLRTKFAVLPARTSADWVKDAVIYEVYLRSFSPEGTFKGLEKRLGEIRKLGVNVLWLMPIHPIGEVNRKGTLGSPYSIVDYYDVNKEFGTLEDFRSLVASVHRHGMKIIIDLVANHTAWDSRMMFENSEWFTKDESGAIVSPNSDWTDVADLDFRRHELRKYMINMMKYWVEEIGIDGYRCDVAELVPTEFWEVARRELDKIKPVLMLSEGTLPEHHVKAFDITYAWNTYDVLEKILAGTTPATVIADILKNESYRFPQGSLRLRFNTNHDKNAWDAPATVKFGKDGALATAALMYTIPGIPLVYNGEEVGNVKRLDLFEKVEIDWTKGKEFREFYERLGSLRSEYAALRRGGFSVVENSRPDRVLSFWRDDSADSILVVMNFSDQPASVRLPWHKDTEYSDYFSGETVQASDGMANVRLGPRGFQVMVPRKKGQS